MKFLVAAALAWAPAAYSQTIASEVAMLPSCALTPLSNAITSAGCGLTDYACQCGPAKSAIITAATPNIISACSTQDALKTQQIAGEICNLVAAGSGSSSASGASSTVTLSSSMASSIGSSMASVTSSAASRASSATSAAPMTTSTAFRASSSASAGTATSSSPASVSSSAAGNLNAVHVLAGVGMIAALAL